MFSNDFYQVKSKASLKYMHICSAYTSGQLVDDENHQI